VTTFREREGLIRQDRKGTPAELGLQSGPILRAPQVFQAVFAQHQSPSRAPFDFVRLQDAERPPKQL